MPTINGVFYTQEQFDDFCCMPIPVCDMDRRTKQKFYQQIRDRLCSLNLADTFMEVVDNGDGSITATNVDGVIVTWFKGDHISICGITGAASEVPSTAYTAIPATPALDCSGLPIDPGTPVINFYDGDGNYINSVVLADGANNISQCGTTNATSQVPATASAATPLVAAFDCNGNAIIAGTEVINHYDGDGNYINSTAIPQPPTPTPHTTNVDNGDNTGTVTDPANDTTCYPQCPTATAARVATDCDVGFMEFDQATQLPTGNVRNFREYGSKIHPVTVAAVNDNLVQTWTMPSSPVGTAGVVINELVDLAAFIPAGVDPSCLTHAAVTLYANASYSQIFNSGDLVPYSAPFAFAGTALVSCSVNSPIVASSTQSAPTAHSSNSNNMSGFGIAPLNGTSVQITGELRTNANLPVAAQNVVLYVDYFLEQ